MIERCRYVAGVPCTMLVMPGVTALTQHLTADAVRSSPLIWRSETVLGSPPVSAAVYVTTAGTLPVRSRASRDSLSAAGTNEPMVLTTTTTFEDFAVRLCDAVDALYVETAQALERILAEGLSKDNTSALDEMVRDRIAPLRAIWRSIQDGDFPDVRRHPLQRHVLSAVGNAWEICTNICYLLSTLCQFDTIEETEAHAARALATLKNRTRSLYAQDSPQVAVRPSLDEFAGNVLQAFRIHSQCIYRYADSTHSFTVPKANWDGMATLGAFEETKFPYDPAHPLMAFSLRLLGWSMVIEETETHVTYHFTVPPPALPIT